MSEIARGKRVRFKYKFYEFIGKVIDIEKVRDLMLIKVRVDSQTFCISNKDVVEVL